MYIPTPKRIDFSSLINFIGTNQELFLGKLQDQKLVKQDDESYQEKA